MATKTVRRRKPITKYLRQPGNWRLKALLEASIYNNPKKVGREWPVDPEYKRSLQRHLTQKQHLHTPPISKKYRLDRAKHSNSYELQSVDNVYNSEGLEKLVDGGGVDLDRHIKRMLTSESETELDVLWREQIEETVRMGADPRRMARQATTVVNVDTRRGTIPANRKETFADTGAEGAEATFDEPDTYAIDYDCVLHEQGFSITDELLDQASPDMIEQRIEDAGRAVENAINRQFINKVLDNATNYDSDQANNNSDIRDLLMKASEVAADSDFDPTDVVVMHPEYASELFGNNQLGGLNGVKSDYGDESRQFVGGHEPFIQSGTAYDSGSVTYGFESDGEHGAVVFGRRYVYTVVETDIETSEFDDSHRLGFTHDLQGGVVRAYTDIVYSQSNSDSGTNTSAVVRVEK